MNVFLSCLRKSSAKMAAVKKSGGPGRGSAKLKIPPDNAEIAELLSREAEKTPYVLQRAYRRAARSAFLWKEEARDLIARRRSLTELAHVGPFLET
jgi:hypothetical protein